MAESRSTGAATILAGSPPSWWSWGSVRASTRSSVHSSATTRLRCTRQWQETTWSGSPPRSYPPAPLM